MNPSTRPRCRRCGKALTAVYTSKETRVEQPTLVGTMEVLTHRERGTLVGYGYAATGFFCSMTCGHWAAVDELKKGGG